MVLGRMVYCLHLFKNLTYVKRDVIKNMFTKSIWRMLPNLAGFSDPLNWNTYLLLKFWCPSNALPCMHFCILSKSTLHKVYQTNKTPSGHVCQLTPPPPPPPPPQQQQQQQQQQKLTNTQTPAVIFFQLPWNFLSHWNSQTPLNLRNSNVRFWDSQKLRAFSPTNGGFSSRNL